MGAVCIAVKSFGERENPFSKGFSQVPALLPAGAVHEILPRAEARGLNHRQGTVLPVLSEVEGAVPKEC